MERKTEHPILFSTPMVQAILEWRKRMTRRNKGLGKINENPGSWYLQTLFLHATGRFTFGPVNTRHIVTDSDIVEVKCPYGQVGDTLWVREKFNKNTIPTGYPYNYYADDDVFTDKDSERWKPSIHMPKAAARIWLEVTNIRIERLQDITEEDAKAEGFESLYCKPTFDGDPFGGTVPASYFFKETFRKLAKSNDIMLNPWVWVIEFKRIEK